MASSSPRSWVEPHLERFGLLRHFDVVRTRDDVALAKPAPDLFLAACQALGVDPAEAVVLEDSAHGATAARAAGVRCVVVPNRLTVLSDLSHADLRRDTLLDLALDDLAALCAARDRRRGDRRGGAGGNRRARERYDLAVTFPQRRLRRLRRTPALRRLVAETHLSVDDLVAPLFVREGIDEPRADRLAARRRAAHPRVAAQGGGRAGRASASPG